MEESGGWTAYHIIIAIATTAGSLAALGGLTLRFLKWYDKRTTTTYRSAARAAIRSLYFTRIELYDLLTTLGPGEERVKSLLQRQIFHVDKSLADAEDAIPNDAREAMDVRLRPKVSINDVVDDGG